MQSGFENLSQEVLNLGTSICKFSYRCSGKMTTNTLVLGRKILSLLLGSTWL